MGMGANRGQGSQVYFDPSNGQYYTMAGGNNLFSNMRARRNYLSGQLNNQPSQINNLVQQAMNAQANPVSMAQLFPYMNYGATNTMSGIGSLGGLLGMTGSSGAGRFLSAPTSNQSTTM